MERNNERLNHALHNELVCNYLELKQEFADWIITTSFYTSLQFVSYKIFPFEVPAIEGKKSIINNIDQLHRYNNTKSLSKHDLLANLVEQQCAEISPDYDWLLDMSMTARYHNYQHDKEIANKALSLMRKIKKFCNK